MDSLPKGREDLRKGWREMLQIILFILKLIGWILLLILGLLVLVLVAALFTPLRYQMETSCKGKLSTLEAGISFRILFRLVNGSMQYRDGNLSWNIRAAWIRLGNKVTAGDVEECIEENAEEKMEEAVNDLKKIEEIEQKEIIEEQAGETGKDKQEARKEQQEAAKAKTSDTEKRQEDSSKKPGDAKERISDEENAKKSWIDKIASVFEKIKYTFDKICGKIRMLLEKAESVKVFLTDEVHQSAFLKCLAELKKMLIRLRPKRIAGEIHFGFEDPSLTGRVLAGASMLYPYWGEHVCCYPDFENKTLKGEVSVEGTLRLLPAAVLAWNLFWNKNVRRTFMDTKRFIFK